MYFHALLKLFDDVAAVEFVLIKILISQKIINIYNNGNIDAIVVPKLTFCGSAGSYCFQWIKKYPQKIKK